MIIKHVILCIFTVALLMESTVASEDMKPYSQPEPGFERMVFRLPAVEQEPDRMVEIMIGKTLPVDCNLHSFLGNLDRHTVAGWGYPYLTLTKVNGPVTTLKACPEGDEKKDAFVQVRGEGFKQRYNSKLPIVVFVPKGFDVRYRIWAAGDEIGRAKRE